MGNCGNPSGGAAGSSAWSTRAHFLIASGSGTGGLNGFTQKLNCRRARLVPVPCEGMKVNYARFGKALKYAAGLGDQ